MRGHFKQWVFAGLFAAATLAATAYAIVNTERVRIGREPYNSNYEALARVDGFKLGDGELDNFRKSAKLPAD